MGLRIQNNVEAFNAHRQLTGTASKAAKAMEKLSSGYRVNRAADDAAGLAISEKMRAQIGGLAQAQRNAQDAVSLVQTGEGALNEVHSMLQRVRDLKVQYSNGTLDDRATRRPSSAEVQQLGKEISDITTQDRVQRHQAADRSGSTFKVGANSADTIALTTATLSGHRRPAPAVATSSSTSARRRAYDADACPAPRSRLARRHRHDDQERVERAFDVRRGAEPPRAPP